MSWINNLFFGSGVAHSVLVLAIVICLGVLLGKLKVRGVSLGITWVLFVGIAASHFGMRIDDELLHFLKEFGLILFVYSIGLQVGPGFFSSFKKGGLKMNLIAVFLVSTGVVTTIALHYAMGVPMPTMVGIMSGAVTNTPGLGAAQQAYSDAAGHGDPTISLGYAVAYPLGVIGMIVAFALVKLFLRINLEKDREAILQQDGERQGATRVSVALTNKTLFGRRIGDVLKLGFKHFVVSRICRKDGRIEIASDDSLIEDGDKVLIVCEPRDVHFITTFIGEKIEMDWTKFDSSLEARRIVVTKTAINGQTLEQIGIARGFNFQITRVNRAGIELLARPDLMLQLGDRVTVVGTQSAIKNVEKIVGNAILNLRHPNIIPLFLGIALGVLLGSIPWSIPGIPQPVKLGLAGGPLVVAILLSRFGPAMRLPTYMTVSSNLMLREVGIVLFLACVGLGAGEKFVETVFEQGGYVWVGYGAVITIFPVFLAGILARGFFKFDYFTLTGVLAGAHTDPPILAYANANAGNDRPSVGYATVYPLTMFLRVLAAQLLIIFFLPPPV